MKLLNQGHKYNMCTKTVEWDDQARCKQANRHFGVRSYKACCKTALLVSMFTVFSTFFYKITPPLPPVPE